tara:strand:+ start:10534 stop:11349 length:816 start_codon:yes stop_codon:yes gene_type:complete
MPLVAKKSLGQHFLEHSWVKKLIAIIKPSHGDIFLEIGPGNGSLTLALAEYDVKIFAVEIDSRLSAMLKKHAPKNVSITNADILKLSISEMKLPRQTRVVGNLPYNISSEILLKLLYASNDENTFTDAHLMFQKEVAERITGIVGSRDWGPLSITTSLFATAKEVLSLPPGAFRPAPKVNSSLIKLTFRPSPVAIKNQTLFDELVRSIFTQRRKMLSNALQSFLKKTSTLEATELYRSTSIDPTSRPSVLAIEDLARLANKLSDHSLENDT